MLGVKLAAVVQQRRSAFAAAAAFDLSDKNHVSTLLVAAAVKAFKAGRCASQQGRTGYSVDKTNALPAVSAPA